MKQRAIYARVSASDTILAMNMPILASRAV